MDKTLELEERISALEISVMELRTPCYKKYALCIRICCFISIITIIAGGFGATFGVTRK
jgi:hypothetical protein